MSTSFKFLKFGFSLKTASGILPPTPTRLGPPSYQQGLHCLRHGPLLLLQAPDLFPQLPQLLPCRDLGVNTAEKEVKQPLSSARPGPSLSGAAILPSFPSY